ncbi:desiccation-related protein PCC13-62-like [Rhodamnia argentea]|uniref:Desiccation-related protein PCC13-62-like n=1 Tax=Rhodamnia argentea TaxID=178133 RepID=A0A8B8PFC6_9MYRT|nr:desiccation-related protein PCC13-62-like [Rhodamnia argentea]
MHCFRFPHSIKTSHTKMRNPSFFSSFFFLLLLSHKVTCDSHCDPIEASDVDRVQFAMNLEFLEAEFFLQGSLGQGLDSFAPYLAQGGPPPVGGAKANLDPVTYRIIEEFGYQEVGHLRAIYTRIGGIRRPLLNLSAQNFEAIFDQAVGHKLQPPFNPYRSTVNYLLASYLIPYVGLVGYVGTIPRLETYNSKSLVASLLGVESGQDAVLRTLLYARADEKVVPYNMTVADFTGRLSGLRNKLAMCGLKEGIMVPKELGAENRTTSNVLSAEVDSLSYSRTPPEMLRIIYGSGSEYKPGGFYPDGGNGRIAQSFLKKD